MVTTHGRLDFIINNACQTVRRPPEFYRHMMEGETAALHELPARAHGLLRSYEMWSGAQRRLGQAGRATRRCPDAVPTSQD